MTPIEWICIGLTACMVGVLYFTRSVLSRRPRREVEGFFGTNIQSLSTLRQAVEAKYFSLFAAGFMVAGFLVQIFGLAYLALRPGMQWTALNTDLGAVVVIQDYRQFFIGIGGVILIGLLGWLTAIFLSRGAFRRYLQEFFQRQKWSFEKNLGITQEIGDLFGIPRTPDETVNAYVAKVRRAVGLGDRG